VSDGTWKLLACPFLAYTQDRDQQQLRIKGELANPSLPEKRPLKWCVVVVVAVAGYLYGAMKTKVTMRPGNT